MNRDVLLIQSPTVQRYRKHIAKMNSFPPLGLLYLGTVLEQRGFRVRTLDLLVTEITEATFRKRLATERPGVVGVSVFTESARFAHEIARVVKEVLPECVVVFGGAFATFAYEDALGDASVDYVVRFEGEVTFAELLERLEREGSRPVRGVRGTAYRDGGSIVVEPPRAPIQRLDDIPIPDRGLVDLDPYTLPFSLMSSRGCPGNCTFCCSGSFWPGVRLRSVENLLEEVALLQTRHGMSGFYMADDTFTVQRRRVETFCRSLIEQRGGVQRGLKWGCESRANAVSRDLLELMYEAGCRRIQFGVESGVPEILRKLRKGVTVEQIVRAVAAARTVGMLTMVSFIHGHPWDTVETMQQTTDFIRELQQRFGVYAMAAVNTPLPGTWQYDHAEELGLRMHSRSWDDFSLNHPNISAPGFTLEQLRDVHARFASSDVSRINQEVIRGAFEGDEVPALRQLGIAEEEASHVDRSTVVA